MGGRRWVGWLLAFVALAALVSCGPTSSRSEDAEHPAKPSSRLDWAIAIHGGAGSTAREVSEDRKQGYLDGLERALGLGRSILDEGGTSLEAVEQVIRVLEDDPTFNAGRGAVFNHDGAHELDASIMDGATLACGAVAAVRTVKNPITLARLVMEKTWHVLLSGEGAERFADQMEVERVPQEYFFTERRWDALQRALETEASAEEKGTVGVAALDRHGNLAAGTSTGGLTNKMFGRVGDSPIIGAGTYANNETCAISGTGKGEEFIRHSVAYAISALMAHEGLSLQQAAERLVLQTLRPGEGGIIGVAADGSIAMVYNTESMLRGAADSSGRFEVAIWD